MNHTKLKNCYDPFMKISEAAYLLHVTVLLYCCSGAKKMFNAFSWAKNRSWRAFFYWF